MRVNIEHTEDSRGIFKKTTYYVVTIKVDFSDEELHIIKDQDIEDLVVLERNTPASLIDKNFDDEAGYWDLKIKSLMLKDGSSHDFHTVGEAKQYATALEEAMPRLKDYISANAGIDETSKTFEL